MIVSPNASARRCAIGAGGACSQGGHSRPPESLITTKRQTTWERRHGVPALWCQHHRGEPPRPCARRAIGVDVVYYKNVFAMKSPDSLPDRIPVKDAAYPSVAQCRTANLCTSWESLGSQLPIPRKLAAAQRRGSRLEFVAVSMR